MEWFSGAKRLEGWRNLMRLVLGPACAVVAGVVGVFAIAAPASAVTANLVETNVVNVYSNTCLDNYHDQLVNDNKVQGWACNGSNARFWTFVKVGGTTASPIFEIELAGTSFCLDNYHGIAASGNPVELFSCNGSAPQLWQGRGGSLVSGNGGGAYCLDLDHGNAANGTKVQIYACNGTDPQLWDYAWQ